MNFQGMGLRQKAILFFDACLVVACALICVIGYINASNGFSSAYEARVADGANFINTIVENEYKGDWSVKGDALYKGDTNMSEATDFLDGLVAGKGEAVTLFAKDTRIATTIKNESGQRNVGTKAVQEVIDAVISKGEQKEVRTEIAGKDYFAHYIPLKSATGETVGMLFYGASSDTVDATEWKFIFNNLIAAIILILVVGFAASRIIAMKMKEIEQVQTAVSQIADGDLSISDLPVVGNDELAALSADTNKMKNSVRHILRGISNAAEQVAAASQELSVSAEETDKSVNSVAESANEMAANCKKQKEQLDVTIYEIGRLNLHMGTLDTESHNMQVAADSSLAGASEGQKIVQNAVNTMNGISKKMEESSEIIHRLGERSSEISQVVDTIASIAGQTNLLALNAAIEAARAGEAGKGFAVVATEVRKLAEQSEEATRNITDMITSIQHDTNEAVKAMQQNNKEIKVGNDIVNQTGEAFSQIAGLTNDMYDQVKKSLRAIRHAKTKSQTINAAVDIVNDLSKRSAEEAQTVSAATEEQSAMMDDISNSSRNMSELASSLQNEIAKFKL